MNHFLLMLICIFSIEIFYFFNFSKRVISILSFSKKVTSVITSNKISDHWKEKVIPVYALRIMKYSLQILLILLLIISLFFITDFFLTNFLAFALSLNGIIESMVFAFGYVYIRKFFIK